MIEICRTVMPVRQLALNETVHATTRACFVQLLTMNIDLYHYVTRLPTRTPEKSGETGGVHIECFSWCGVSS